MAQWLRFEQDGRTKFGTLQDGVISIHSGDMFSNPTDTILHGDAGVEIW